MMRNEKQTKGGSTNESQTASNHACSIGCVDLARDGVRTNLNAGPYCQALSWPNNTSVLESTVSVPQNEIIVHSFRTDMLFGQHRP
jgi:hypothetical protein